MNYGAIERRVDDLGRVVIPVDLRRCMGIETGTVLQLEYRDGDIILKMPKQHCQLCGSTIRLVEFDDAWVCLDCVEKIQSFLDGRQRLARSPSSVSITRRESQPNVNEE